MDSLFDYGQDNDELGDEQNNLFSVTLKKLKLYIFFDNEWTQKVFSFLFSGVMFKADRSISWQHYFSGRLHQEYVCQARWCRDHPVPGMHGSN